MSVRASFAPDSLKTEVLGEIIAWMQDFPA
jgi:hypothetical protein